MAFLWDPQPFLATSPQESEDRFIKQWLTRQYGTESLADGKLQNVVAGYFNMPWLTQPSKGKWLGEVCANPIVDALAHKLISILAPALVCVPLCLVLNPVRTNCNRAIWHKIFGRLPSSLQTTWTRPRSQEASRIRLATRRLARYPLQMHTQQRPSPLAGHQSQTHTTRRGYWRRRCLLIVSDFLQAIRSRSLRSGSTLLRR